jgi:hypothetical protein
MSSGDVPAQWWHYAKAGAERNIKQVPVFFQRFPDIDGDALQRDLLAVLEKHVPRDEPEGEGE